jgi:hypothetical protein
MLVNYLRLGKFKPKNIGGGGTRGVNPMGVVTGCSRN